MRRQLTFFDQCQPAFQNGNDLFRMGLRCSFTLVDIPQFPWRECHQRFCTKRDDFQIFRILRVNPAHGLCICRFPTAKFLRTDHLIRWETLGKRLN